MPIWSVMCFRMLMMRSAMPFTSCNLLYHCFRKSGVFRMVAAIRAPLRGGLEYMGRIKIFNCDSTLLASSASLQIIVKNMYHAGGCSLPYKPMFLRQILMPCSMKWRTAQASLSPSPLAKPW
uniref:Secreted protein n=1 Tax=Cebus imitator TaxID=2715852 RepID=A0A2K5SID2_CEBIM